MVTTKLLSAATCLAGTPNYYLIGELSPEADSITPADPLLKLCGAKNADIRL